MWSSRTEMLHISKTYYQYSPDPRFFLWFAWEQSDDALSDPYAELRQCQEESSHMIKTLDHTRFKNLLCSAKEFEPSSHRLILVYRDPAQVNLDQPFGLMNLQTKLLNPFIKDEIRKRFLSSQESEVDEFYHMFRSDSRSLQIAGDMYEIALSEKRRREKKMVLQSQGQP